MKLAIPTFRPDWSRIVWISLFIIISLGLLFLLSVSWSLTIDYWDGFAQLVNAKEMAKRGELYFAFRPLFSSLVNVPLLMLERYGLSLHAIFRLSHLLSFTMGLGLLLVFYRFLRTTFTPGVSIFATLLLSLNRLFIHYTPFTMTDIPAALFFALSLFLYLRLKEKKSLALRIYFIISTTLALLTKFNMGLLLPTILSYELLLAARDKRSFKEVSGNIREFLSCFLLATLLFVGVHLLVFTYIFKNSSLESLNILKNNFFPTLDSFSTSMHKNITGGFFGSFSVYLSVLLKSSGVVPLILFFLGSVAGLFRRRNEDILCLIWLILFFSVMSFMFTHRESRYILPLLFPIYYFAANFLDLLTKRLLPFARHQKIMAGIAGCLLLLPSVNAALVEYKHFLDPIYRTPFVTEVSRIAREAVLKGNRVFWWGSMYPLFPKDYVFIPEDPHFYIYHFHQNAIHFFGAKPPFHIQGDYPFFYQGTHPKKHYFLKSGDICLLSFPYVVVTDSLPQKMPPFIVLEAKRIEFSLKDPGGKAHHYEEVNGSNTFDLQSDGKDLVLRPHLKNIEGADLYLVRQDRIVSLGWSWFSQETRIRIRNMDRDEVKEIVLIIPLVKAVFYPDG